MKLNKAILQVILCALTISCTKTSSKETPAPAQGIYVSEQFKDTELAVLNNLRYSERPNRNGTQYTSDLRKSQEAGDSKLSLLLDLMIPPNATSSAKQPLIVMVHGGAFRAGNKEDITASARTFAVAGYVTANVNYRLTPLSNNDASAFVNAVVDASEDVMNAIRFLKSRADEYHIDTNRVAMIGYSAGGGITLINSVSADVLAGTVSDYPGISSRIQAGISTGATLVQPGIIAPQAFLSFDRNDAPVMLLHARPRDGAVGTTWDDHVLPTQKLMVDAGAVCELVAQPDKSHTVNLSVGADYWQQQSTFLWKYLRLSPGK